MKTHVLSSLVLFVVSVSASELKVFFGNLHAHTSYSDGSGTPDEAFRFARNRGKLDFLAITEHNHTGAETAAVEKNHTSIAHNPLLYKGTWGSLVESANRHTRPGEFVALYGQEFSATSRGNHVNVFDIDAVIDEDDVPNRQFDQLLRWLHHHKDSQGKNAIIQFNHPKKEQREAGEEYGADDFGSQANWIHEMGKHAALISVVNGPSHEPAYELSTSYHTEEAYRYYLNLGFKLAPTCDQDTHYKNWGLATRTRTGVIADELTKPKILQALRQRHVYGTQDKNLRVIFFVEGQLCGDVITNLPSAGSDLRIEYVISDDDEPNASYRIQIFSDKVGDAPGGRLPLAINTDGNNTLQTRKQIEEVPFTGVGQYVWFKIIQENEDDGSDYAWTAPVWFERPSSPASPILITSTDTAVASRNSPIFHLTSTCARARNISPGNLLTGLSARTGRQQHTGCPLL